MKLLGRLLIIHIKQCYSDERSDWRCQHKNQSAQRGQKLPDCFLVSSSPSDWKERQLGFTMDTLWTSFMAVKSDSNTPPLFWLKCASTPLTIQRHNRLDFAVRGRLRHHLASPQAGHAGTRRTEGAEWQAGQSTSHSPGWINQQSQSYPPPWRGSLLINTTFRAEIMIQSKVSHQVVNLFVIYVSCPVSPLAFHTLCVMFLTFLTLHLVRRGFWWFFLLFTWFYVHVFFELSLEFFN